jgi:hypothetical protein
MIKNAIRHYLGPLRFEKPNIVFLRKKCFYKNNYDF